jgi:hypothetical protein
VDGSADYVIEGVAGDPGAFADVRGFDFLFRTKLLDDLAELDGVKMEVTECA